MAETEAEISLKQAAHLLWPQFKSLHTAKVELISALRNGKLDAFAERVGRDHRDGTKELLAENVVLSPDFWIRPWANWEENYVMRIGPRQDEFDPLNPDRLFRSYVAFGIKINRANAVSLIDLKYEPKKLSSPIIPLQRRPRGSSYEKADRFLFAEIERLLSEGKAQGAHGAALLIADRIAGAGTPTSKAKRVAKLFNGEKTQPP